MKARNAGNPGNRAFEPREAQDQEATDDIVPGYLYLSTKNPWPIALDEILDRVPEDWVEEHRGQRRIKKSQRANAPELIRVAGDGTESASGIEVSFVGVPFRFCLCCGVAYGARQKSDFAKLASLSSEGRSTATTILSLSAIRGLKNEASLHDRSRKLLSFTDNRQDASLQAGHFNDFIEVGLLRAALYKAVAKAGQAGIAHDELPERVFQALDLPIELYARDAAVRFQALKDTQSAIRTGLGYRLYRDLKRGWRITLPNLEQCGLLEIRYQSLEELCASQADWSDCHAALAGASPETRQRIAKVLLDHIRRELAIQVDISTRRIRSAFASKVVSIFENLGRSMKANNWNTPPFYFHANPASRMTTVGIFTCLRPAWARHRGRYRRLHEVDDEGPSIRGEAD